MPSEITTEIGRISITDDVISAIAGFAAIENYGLVGMNAKTVSQSVISLAKKDNYKRGVAVRCDGGDVAVDLFVMLEYGVSLVAVAENVIQNVRYRVEEATGLNVIKVNVHIDKIRVNS